VGQSWQFSEIASVISFVYARNAPQQHVVTPNKPALQKCLLHVGTLYVRVTILQEKVNTSI
jgi:hypothetical protein